MATLDEDLFDRILDGFHIRGAALCVRGNVGNDLIGKRLRLCEVVPADGHRRLVDRPGDLFLLERRARTVALDNVRNHK